MQVIDSMLVTVEFNREKRFPQGGGVGGRGVFAPCQPEFDNLPIPTLPNEGEMICKGGSKIFD
jgi:hypothetical protein